MNNNRRGFLLYSGFLSLSRFFQVHSEKLSLDSRKSFFLVICETFFPKPLLFSAYKELQRKYMNIDDLNKLQNLFYTKARILNQDTIITSTGYQSIFLFDKKSSYYLWCYTVVSKNFIDELIALKNGVTFENYGYYIPKASYKKPIKLLISDLKKTKAIPLHQTKTVNDLNEFQKRSQGIHKT